MLRVERFSPDTASFDEASTRRLGLAFDKACALLGRAPQPTNVREIVAKGIIEAAKQGERDFVCATRVLLLCAITPSMQRSSSERNLALSRTTRRTVSRIGER
jgi:hypothetical protein